MTTLVLAAGRSRRFGWANKLLAPINGRPLVVVALSRVLAATRGPVLVVLDHQARAVRAALVRHGVVSNRLHFVYAFGARHDMHASRARVVRAAPELSSALQVHLADVPYMDARLVRRMRRAIHEGATAVRPMHGAAPGHPVRWSVARLHHADARPRADPQHALRALPEREWRRIPGPPGCVQDIDRRQMLRVLNCTLVRAQSRDARKAS